MTTVDDNPLNGLVDLVEASASDMTREMARDLARFRMRYKFAIDEVSTKIAILREEFEHTHDHSPIEHVRPSARWCPDEGRKTW